MWEILGALADLAEEDKAEKLREEAAEAVAFIVDGLDGEFGEGYLRWVKGLVGDL